MTISKTLFADEAWLPDGWAENVSIAIDDIGDIRKISISDDFDPENMDRVRGPLLPGMPNLHSHAHQRAMAGMSEYRSSDEGEDSFWTWREVMHAFAEQVTPEVLEAIATQLYVEMLKSGYTSVCEFHYMHHQVGGALYDDPAEMSYALIRAARTAGIGLTLLPVLYSHGGYGGKEANAGQLRFMSSPDQLIDIISNSRSAVVEDPGMNVGIAPHSPRQVTWDSMRLAISGLNALDAGAPIHIHVSEQESDIDDSLAHTGFRPVDWVFEHFDVDCRWCLIHATHLSVNELVRIAKSDAVVGICPTTEANLGDGLFPLMSFLREGGCYGIGSDSHISVSVTEELRWLEYAQRLAKRRRNLTADVERSTGTRLYADAISGGARATGRKIDGIRVGNRADFVTLDTSNPNLVARSGARLIDSMIFAGNGNVIGDVWAGGRKVVISGQHVTEVAVFEAFRSVMVGMEL